MLGMIKKKILIFAIVAAAVGGGIFLYFKIIKPPADGEISGEKPVACNQEAKLCPDGSYVGRTGPNCEFTTCPENISLPQGYTLENYSVAKILETACVKNSDCETPDEYQVLSSCPFTSICLENKCAVVCPAHIPTPEIPAPINNILQTSPPSPDSLLAETPTKQAGETSPPLPQKILLNIPFTPQAPFANWADPKQEHGCEEASILMVMRWVEGKSLSPAEAEKEIIAISNFEQEKYGEFRDDSAADTARLIKDYFNYQNIELILNADAEKIKNEIINGNAVIAPVNGQKLKNPYYTPPGPVQHMLVIKGYDAETKEFITNDSGTKRGENYRYNEKILEDALQDYLTGFHEPIFTVNKVMIVIKPPGISKPK